YHLAFAAAKSSVEAPDSHESINLLPPVLQEHYQAQSQFKFVKNASNTLIIATIIVTVMSTIAFGLSWWATQSIAKALPAAEVAPTDTQLNPGDYNRHAQRIVKLFPLKVTPEKPLAILQEVIPAGIEPIQLSYDANKKLY